MGNCHNLYILQNTYVFMVWPIQLRESQAAVYMERRPHHTIILFVKYVIHVSNKWMFAYLQFCLELNKWTSSWNLDFGATHRNATTVRYTELHGRIQKGDRWSGTPPGKSQVAMKDPLPGPPLAELSGSTHKLDTKRTLPCAHVL